MKISCTLHSVRMEKQRKWKVSRIAFGIQPPAVLMPQTGSTYLFINVQKLVSCARVQVYTTQMHISTFTVYFILQTYSGLRRARVSFCGYNRRKHHITLFLFFNVYCTSISKEYIQYFLYLHSINYTMKTLSVFVICRVLKLHNELNTIFINS